MTQIVIVTHLGQSSIYWSYASKKQLALRTNFTLSYTSHESPCCTACVKRHLGWSDTPDPSLPSEIQDNIETWAITNSEQSKGKQQSQGLETAMLKKMCQPRQPEQIRACCQITGAG